MQIITPSEFKVLHCEENREVRKYRRGPATVSGDNSRRRHWNVVLGRPGNERPVSQETALNCCLSSIIFLLKQQSAKWESLTNFGETFLLWALTFCRGLILP
jgi:hypothetical protein